MNIAFTEEAVNDLKRIISFIEQKNPVAAQDIACKVDGSVNRLANFPQLGIPISTPSSADDIRDLHIPNYTIRYTIASSTIYILRIWHDKEDERSN